MNKDPYFLIPFIEDTEIWGKADAVRESTVGNCLPVNIDLIIEKYHHVQIVPVPGLKRLAGAEALILSSLLEIDYDSNLPAVRIRFSLAHELGHKILHGHLIESIKPPSYEEWEKLQEEIPDVIRNRAEYQAYEFAGRLLVPREVLIEEVKALGPLIERAKAQAPKLSGDELKGFIAGRICRKFDVSDQVISRRLQREKINPFRLPEK